MSFFLGKTEVLVSVVLSKTKQNRKFGNRRNNILYISLRTNRKCCTLGPPHIYIELICINNVYLKVDPDPKPSFSSLLSHDKTAFKFLCLYFLISWIAPYEMRLTVCVIFWCFVWTEDSNLREFLHWSQDTSADYLILKTWISYCKNTYHMK